MPPLRGTACSLRQLVAARSVTTDVCAAADAWPTGSSTMNVAFGCCGAVRGVRRALIATAFTVCMSIPAHPLTPQPTATKSHTFSQRSRTISTHSPHGTARHSNGTARHSRAQYGIQHGTARRSTAQHASVRTPRQDTEEEVEPRGEAKPSLEIVETLSIPKRLSRAWSLTGRRALSRGPEASGTPGPEKPSPHLEAAPAAPGGPRVTAAPGFVSGASGLASGLRASGSEIPGSAAPSVEEEDKDTAPVEHNQDTAPVELSQSWKTAPMEELSQGSNNSDSEAALGRL